MLAMSADCIMLVSSHNVHVCEATTTTTVLRSSPLFTRPPPPPPLLPLKLPVLFCTFTYSHTFTLYSHTFTLGAVTMLHFLVKGGVEGEKDQLASSLRRAKWLDDMAIDIGK